MKQNRINIMDIPEGKTFEDYPKDTIFVWDDHDQAEDDSFWNDADTADQ